MILPVGKDGYVARKIALTNGRFEWVTVTGRHRGNFLLKSSHFDLKLDPVSVAASGPMDTIRKDGPLRASDRPGAEITSKENSWAGPPRPSSFPAARSGSN
jgi:hypothetical protein